ncbi:DUF2750 domain-containing protein [Denitrobaculum tricleocarpae]|uniref:DUF2750 domain-containing protein n=1 Tax=Denitrobaculum tricleocarpae TaxID=2591009 RepID=A0A545T839_9PROT|nr:DUF2750 domain-containing protein [Denitrobaculum tricleocarpae]TQV73372.1 DUF2750 domain-containing protein [Denitrobaculum tricleocarpae]
MNEKQIENLLNQSAQERYEYFVRYCADFQEVWGLTVGEDGWVIFKDSDGDEVFPLWPHKDLAEVCCFGEHRSMGAKPQSIPLDSFLQNCVPDMISEKIYFGVFYNKSREGLAVDGYSLKEALEAEVSSVWE